MIDILALFILPLSVALYMAWRLEKDRANSILELTTNHNNTN